jgi:hypothetical protein
MRHLTTTLCLTIAVLHGSAGCQTTSLISYSGVSGGNLPPCSGQPTPRTWTNCHGSYHKSDGEKFVGEWKDGKKHGQGTLTFAKSGNKYVGEFRNTKMNGQGTLISPDGSSYVGEWKN